MGNRRHVDRGWKGVKRWLFTPAAAMVLLALLVADAVFLLPRETVVGGIVDRALRGRRHGPSIFSPEAWIYERHGALELLDPYAESERGNPLNADEAAGFAMLFCRERLEGVWAATRVRQPLNLEVQPNKQRGDLDHGVVRAKFAEMLETDADPSWRVLAEPVREGVKELRRPLPLGYLHNAAALVVFVGFLYATGSIPGAIRRAVREDRLMKRRCPTCEYDLAGLGSERCPECGDALVVEKQRA